MDQVIDRIMNSEEIGAIIDNKNRELIKAKMVIILQRFHRPGEAMPMNLSNTDWLTCVDCMKRTILATRDVKTLARARFGV